MFQTQVLRNTVSVGWESLRVKTSSVVRQENVLDKWFSNTFAHKNHLER